MRYILENGSEILFTKTFVQVNKTAIDNSIAILKRDLNVRCYIAQSFMTFTISYWLILVGFIELPFVTCSRENKIGSNSSNILIM